MNEKTTVKHPRHRPAPTGARLHMRALHLATVRQTTATVKP